MNNSGKVLFLVSGNSKLRTIVLPTIMAHLFWTVSERIIAISAEVSDIISGGKTQYVAYLALISF